MMFVSSIFNFKFAFVPKYDEHIYLSYFISSFIELIFFSLSLKVQVHQCSVARIYIWFSWISDEHKNWFASLFERILWNGWCESIWIDVAHSNFSALNGNSLHFMWILYVNIHDFPKTNSCKIRIAFKPLQQFSYNRFSYDFTAALKISDAFLNC